MQVHILGRKDDLKTMQQVSETIKKLGAELNIKTEIFLTHNFSEIPGQSFNPAKTPIIFFDKHVEFTGIPDRKLLTAKLIESRDKGSGGF